MCVLSCTPSPVNSSSTFLNHSGFCLCLTGWSHMSLQSGYFPLHQAPPFSFLLRLIHQTISFGLIQTSDSACTALSYCHIIQALVQLQLTSAVLPPGPRQYLFLLCDISLQALIWYPDFVTRFFSFYLTVLNPCVVPSTFPKFISFNVVS